MSGGSQDPVAGTADSWAVIGAGVHGLSALKALLQCGVPAQAYERESEVGGNWNFGAGNSRVYASTHTISTKPFTQMPDFPMPDSYPDYPSHRQIQAYFVSYARHFGLYDHIRFGTEVVRVRPAGDAVDITVSDRVTGEQYTVRHAGVVIANGHNWNPKVPQYPGLDGFTGTVLHSAQYKDPELLRGRRVLVVGAGNTGCDIAVDSAQNAARTLHSTRRGYWYSPKFAFGRPSDQIADLLLALRVPLAVRRMLFKLTIGLTVGDLRRFGIAAPDHDFFQTHPIVNQQLPYYVGHGDIVPKPDVRRFDGDTVTFADGTSEEIDVAVFATGYLATFPFADDALVNIVAGRAVLARQMFTPAHPRVVIGGLIQPDSGQWALAHWQGMLVGRYARAWSDHPQLAARYYGEAIAAIGERYSGGTDYTDSTRHFYEIAHQDYLRALESDLHMLEDVA